MGMSAYYGKPDENESIATIHRALDLGINFLDTADMYAAGRNEELIGRAIRNRRSDVVLATKFGNVSDSQGNFIRLNGRPEYALSACDASLTRLNTDQIDLYYLHRVDPMVPIEETIGAMSMLVSQGKIRFVGISEANGATIRRAHLTHPLAALQTEYSLWSRDPENGLLDLCNELGIGFIAYSPLGRGFLTGTITHPDDLAAEDSRLRSPRFKPTNFERNRQLLAQLEQVAQRKGCNQAQLSLAWLLAQSPNIVPIPGTKRRRCLEENVHALAVQLTKKDLAEIDRLMPNGIAAGRRYSDEMMMLVDG
jgi:aryl-alcohol dehydrogenase-like predicted oxidoreductase